MSTFVAGGSHVYNLVNVNERMEELDMVVGSVNQRSVLRHNSALDMKLQLEHTMERVGMLVEMYKKTGAGASGTSSGSE